MKDSWYVDACRTWSSVVEEHAERYPDKVLFVCEDKSITFREFRDLVNDFAKGLVSIGVKKGDVVGIWMPNCLEWIVCQFAAYRAGALLLSLYSYYRRSEMEYALKQSGVNVLITTDTFLGKIDALSILSGLLPELAVHEADALKCAGFPDLRSVIVLEPRVQLPGRLTYGELLERGKQSSFDAELWERQAAASPFDVMNIMYTSGTTGFPKAGMSMHITNLTTINLWSKHAGLTPDDVILCHVPLFTNFGGLYGACLGIWNACKVVITRQFAAAESLRLIGSNRVTYVPGTPSMFRIMLDDDSFASADLSSVRGGHVAGAPLSGSLMREIIEVFGAREIMQAWGLSECGGLSTVTTALDPMNKRLNTVGRPLRSALVKIVDTESLEELPPATPGEIWLGDVHPGSCVGKGYFRDAQKTAATITADGWFRTGDMGFFDEDGYLHLVGRVDDMFTVGGFNVYPAEIENDLMAIPGVKEAFVVPMDDRRLGSVPVAWIAGDSGITEQQVIDVCKGRMTPQKTPRKVFFYTPGELPMTPSGKVRKKELTAKTAELISENGGG